MLNTCKETVAAFGLVVGGFIAIWSVIVLCVLSIIQLLFHPIRLYKRIRNWVLNKNDNVY